MGASFFVEVRNVERQNVENEIEGMKMLTSTTDLSNDILT
jgi:hypothetical protein